MGSVLHWFWLKNNRELKVCQGQRCKTEWNGERLKVNGGWIPAQRGFVWHPIGVMARNHNHSGSHSSQFLAHFIWFYPVLEAHIICKWDRNHKFGIAIIHDWLTLSATIISMVGSSQETEKNVRYGPESLPECAGIMQGVGRAETRSLLVFLCSIWSLGGPSYCRKLPDIVARAYLYAPSRISFKGITTKEKSHLARYKVAFLFSRGDLREKSLSTYHNILHITIYFIIFSIISLLYMWVTAEFGDIGR